MGIKRSRRLRREKPSWTKDNTTQPGRNQLGKNQPGVNQPSVNQPSVNQPSANQPGANQPGANQPGINQAGDVNFTSSQKTTGPCKPNTFFYDMPNSTLLVLFIAIVVILSLVGLTVYKYFVPKGYFTFDSNSLVAIFIGIIGVPVGVILAFIITGVWQAFNDASAKNEKEASDLLFLYRTVQQIPGTGTILISIRNYINYIITVEFPQMREGIIPVAGLALLLSIGEQIYNIDPRTPKDIVMYKESIDIYNEILALRASRIGFLDGLAPELWWVLIIGVALIIVMSYFVYCRRVILQYLMTAFVAAGLASLLFLIVALDLPYEGQFSLSDNSFIGALELIDGATEIKMKRRRGL